MTNFVYILELLTRLVLFVVEGFELAYTAPSAIIMQRKRGLTQKTKDDLLLEAALKQGKSATQIETIGTDEQKNLFTVFKTGMLLHSYYNMISQCRLDICVECQTAFNYISINYLILRCCPKLLGLRSGG